VTSLKQADRDQRVSLTETFLTLYLPPMRSYLNRQFDWLNPHDREDVMQGFILDRFVQHSLLDFADRNRGKMRAFLCRCLHNYALNWTRRDRKRSAVQVGDLNCLMSAEVSESATAIFDVMWARYVLTETILRMKDECHDLGKQLVWDTFDLRLLRPVLTGQAAVPYGQLAQKLDSDERKLQNLLVTAKRLLGRKLRDVIEQYVEGEQAIQEEIDDLMRIIAQHGPLLENEAVHDD
jgi:DNA-directed RNA polymerase specialized sigma24 family protein